MSCGVLAPDFVPRLRMRASCDLSTSTEENSMLWTVFVILIVLWLLGLIGHVAGGFIHLLLVVAVIVLVIRLVQGRAP